MHPATLGHEKHTGLKLDDDDDVIPFIRCISKQRCSHGKNFGFLAVPNLKGINLITLSVGFKADVSLERQCPMSILELAKDLYTG